jgi:hypothetical protein
MKKFLLILLIIFIAIQFFRPVKNIAMDGSAFKNDISTIYIIPDSIHHILEASCYDCHSNNTAYPWYNNIQPVAWWLNKHIQNGKNALNFSEFASYTLQKKYKKLNGLVKEVRSDGMPLSSYTIIHRYAILSANQKDELIKWASSITDSIKANTSADSLQIRK